MKINIAYTKGRGNIMETKISNTLTLITPDNYQRIELSFFDEWVAALRSGKYGQGDGLLYDPKKEAYCCLGVLSKLQGRLKETPGGSFGDTTGESSFSTSSLAVDNECYGVIGPLGRIPPDCSVRVAPGDTLSRLSSLNDWGATFEEIATIIEKLWKPKSVTQ